VLYPQATAVPDGAILKDAGTGGDTMIRITRPRAAGKWQHCGAW